MSTPPVWLEGDGFIDANGRYWPEAKVRAGLEVIKRLAAWIDALPAETRDVLIWEAELHTEAAP